MRKNSMNRAMACGAMLMFVGTVTAQTLALGHGKVRADVRSSSAGEQGIRGTSESGEPPSAESGAALSASVPALGLVALNGTVYRIAGIPGGASLVPVETPAGSRAQTFSRSGEQLLSQGGSLWVRATSGQRFLELGDVAEPETESTALDAGMPIGLVSLSRSGRAMAVASDDATRVDIYQIDGMTATIRDSVELGSGVRHIQSIIVSDQASTFIALTESDGWMEAIAWSADANATTSLAQGQQLRADLSADGTHIAVLDLAVNRMSVFAARASGISLSSAQDLPLSENDDSTASIAGVYWIGGRFVSASIRDRDVRICAEGGDCESLRLPIPAARGMRSLPGDHLLFVESDRIGVPSYLLDFSAGHARWHFVGRTGQVGRQLEAGNGTRGRLPLRR